MADRQQIDSLIARELAIMTDRRRRDALHSILVEPRLEEREWDYGRPGDRFHYWVVAEARDEGIILVYCEHGFGPESPWGFLFTDARNSYTLGMDSQWDWYLEGAFVTAGLWAGEVRRNEAFLLPPEQRFRSDAGHRA